MHILKQSTAVDVLVGPFVDSSDGDTEETALTINSADVKLSKNGQTMAGKNQATACVHDSQGMYKCALDATDTDTIGNMVLFVHVAGALAARHEFQIVEEAVYDSLFGSGATAIATAASITALNDFDPATDTVANVTTTANVTNQVTADVTAISGDAAAANNLEAMFDGTGYSDTNAPATQGQATTIDTNVDSIKAVTDSVETGSAVAGTLSATQMSTDLTEATNDHYNGRLLTFTSGTLNKQQAAITDYDGTTKVLTFSELTEAPAISDTFIIS